MHSLEQLSQNNQLPQEEYGTDIGRAGSVPLSGDAWGCHEKINALRKSGLGNEYIPKGYTFPHQNNHGKYNDEAQSNEALFPSVFQGTNSAQYFNQPVNQLLLSSSNWETSANHLRSIAVPPLQQNSLPQQYCIGPYDIAELKVTSLHALDRNREATRIIGIAAGESLHNIYRVIMTALNQREDRARLVFHAWILPDGQVFGNGPRYRDTLKNMANDRDLYLNELPIGIGYQLELVFGKCVYSVMIADLFVGFTDEQDLIWTPRVCEGSYGEPVPFDLCYSPHLFRLPRSETVTDLPIKKEIGTTETVSEEKNYCDSPTYQRLSHLRPVTTRDQFLTSDELDEINRNLSRMRFIRQYSQIKPLLRKNRPEDYIPDESRRRQCFRMTPRNFFFFLWSHQAMENSPLFGPSRNSTQNQYIPDSTHSALLSSQSSTTTTGSSSAGSPTNGNVPSAPVGVTSHDSATAKPKHAESKSLKASDNSCEIENLHQKNLRRSIDSSHPPFRLNVPDSTPAGSTANYLPRSELYRSAFHNYRPNYNSFYDIPAVTGVLSAQSYNMSNGLLSINPFPNPSCDPSLIGATQPLLRHFPRCRVSKRLPENIENKEEEEDETQTTNSPNIATKTSDDSEGNEDSSSDHSTDSKTHDKNKRLSCKLGAGETPQNINNNCDQELLMQSGCNMQAWQKRVSTEHESPFAISSP